MSYSAAGTRMAKRTNLIDQAKAYGSHPRVKDRQNNSFLKFKKPAKIRAGGEERRDEYPNLREFRSVLSSWF
jgi:hypothetical protein